MSAYALPGLIFPPMPGCGFESSYVISSSFSSSSSSSTGESSYQSSSTSMEKQQHSRPQHIQSPISSPYQFKPVDFSSMQTSPIAANSPLTPVRPAPLKVDESNDAPGGSKVGISVKDAKIDPVQLVKSLTTTSTKTRKRDHSIPKNSQQLTATTAITSTANSSKACPTRKSITPPMKKLSSDEDDDEDDPHKDAIQFELNISWNGRTYSATRTMPRIVQLRNDLISELSSRRTHALRRMRWIKKKRTTKNTEYIDTNQNTEVEDDDLTVKSVNDGEIDDNSDDDDFKDVKIPELPDYYCSAQERSSGGRGFALLHALLRSYCPVMEGWLLKVSALVPDSPSLSRFLWEPVSGDSSCSNNNNNLMRSTNSFGALVSIKEDVSEDESEEGEDDVFAF